MTQRIASPGFIITGTDTDIGKTVFTAALLHALNAAGHMTSYWKPIQSGLNDMVDTRTVQKLAGIDPEYCLPESYVLTEPLSPHRSAELDGVEIKREALAVPSSHSGGLLIEGAGGVMVPFTRKQLFINQFKRWNMPVIVVARAQLGTINHTLLTLEALWARAIPIHGIAFVGAGEKDNIKTIAELSGERVLGHLPHLDPLTPSALQAAFAHAFRIHDFLPDESGFL